MKEEELLYHFPYHIDKELNFRFAKDYKEFVKRYIPDYDGTNIPEFIERKTSFTMPQRAAFFYDYENYSRWNEWYENGKNIFSFSKELLTMLEKTDASDITPDAFHPPFDTFFLSLKPLELKINNDTDAIIEGVYIDHNIWDYNGEHPDGYCNLSLYFVGDFKELYTDFYSNVTSNIEGLNNTIEEDPIGSFWNVWLTFDKQSGRITVKNAIDSFINGLKDEIKVEGNTTLHTKKFFDSTIDLLDTTLNLIINCLLYLSQPADKKDVEPRLPKGLPGNLDKKLLFARTSKDRDKVERTYEQMGFSKINYVGQSFKERYCAILNGSVQPHWRRGHWRNQKIGEGRKDSKAIWILPTIVNKERGEPQKGHVYYVQGNS